MMFKEHVEVSRPEWLSSDLWHDSSWHNDAMPHASLFLTADESPDGPVVEFWVNYPDTESREMPDRFMVVFQRCYSLESGTDELLWSGEDENQARMFAFAAEIAKTIIRDILCMPEVAHVRTFSDLHDYCDANMLGAQEIALTERGWIGNDDTADQVALNSTVELLNQAQGITDLWLRTRAV